MTKIIHVQGASANCGKTTFLVGLLRKLKSMNISVAPFKSVSVLSLKSYGYLNSVEQLCEASGNKYSDINNPVVIIPKNSPGIADLYLEGNFCCEIELLSTDTPNFKSLNLELLNRIKKCIRLKFEELSNNYEYILVEGSSCPSDMFGFEEYDLSNNYIYNEFPGDLILVANAYDGGHWSSIYGNHFLKKSHNFKGYILNGVIDINSEIIKEQINTIHRDLEMRCFGLVPRVDYFDHIKESTPDMFEEEYDIWSRIITEFIDYRNIIN